MIVGAELLRLASAAGRRALFVVGTGKNAGKTVVVRAIAQSAHAAGVRFGITSIGRDGEPFDISDARSKPRLFLRPGAMVATARDVLARHPASEILDVSDLQTAAGPLVYARVIRAGYFEIAGPPTAAGVRTCLSDLERLGCEQTIVDGAVDRVAALAGGNDAVVVSVGASNAPTVRDAVDDVRALVARLSVPQFDPSQPFVRLDGALTAGLAAALAGQHEGRQVVVRDPTQIAVSGKAFLGIAQRLHLRCERPLDVIATTVGSIGLERYFEPREFLGAVAEATGLPAFDVFAGRAA
ncbi:MAG: hypothetical protein M3R35_05265 [Candidatus Eremiobacteraeota bacterium]|nr:hypothetical protein [Candidatus Eremiobacteraeota bacterium]